VLIGLGVGATLCLGEVICDDDPPSPSPADDVIEE